MSLATSPKDWSLSVEATVRMGSSGWARIAGRCISCFSLSVPSDRLLQCMLESANLEFPTVGQGQSAREHSEKKI